MTARDHLAAVLASELGTLRLAVSHERGVESHDPFRLDVVSLPVVERGAEARPLLDVELDRPARSYCLEPFANRLRSPGESELREQHVALVPGDRDEFARDVDLDAIETLGHRPEAIA